MADSFGWISMIFWKISSGYIVNVMDVHRCLGPISRDWTITFHLIIDFRDLPVQETVLCCILFASLCFIQDVLVIEEVLSDYFDQTTIEFIRNSASVAGCLPERVLV
jgi:hypothetical protein